MDARAARRRTKEGVEEWSYMVRRWWYTRGGETRSSRGAGARAVLGRLVTWRTARWLAALLLVVWVFATGDRLTVFVREPVQRGTWPSTDLGDVLTGVLLPGPVSRQGPDVLGGVLAVVLAGLIVLYRIAARANRRPGEEHGSAGWARPGTARFLRAEDPGEELELVEGVGLGLEGRWTNRNANVLVVGAPGTGKSRSYVIPNARRLHASMAFTDPKKELYPALVDELEDRGLRVRVLDLVDLDQSWGFNPLAYLDPAHPEPGILQIVDAVLMNTSGRRPAGADAFWDRAERALLSALVAYVMATQPNGEGESSLVDVMDLHHRLSAGEGAHAHELSDVDLQFQAAAEIVAEWESDGRPGEPDEVVAMQTLAWACRQFTTFSKGAGETRKSIIISVGVRLAPLDMDPVRRIVAKDSIGLDRVGREPTAIFLAVPDTHAAFAFVAALFWQSFFSVNVYEADHSGGGRLPLDVHAFLDEFANVGKIPSFERVITTVRSRGISASIIVQARSQGEAMWDKDWATIEAACDTTLYLGGDDLATCRWVSERLGSQTVVSREVTSSRGRSGGMSRADRLIKRPLMTPDEVARLADDQAIVLIRGLRPIRGRKLRLAPPRRGGLAAARR